MIQSLLFEMVLGTVDL